MRNLGSGDVEAVVAGKPEDVHAFVDWARRGPPNARVTRIDISEIEIPSETGFVQRPTAQTAIAVHQGLQPDARDEAPAPCKR